jgi:hypothetical protein
VMHSRCDYHVDARGCAQIKRQYITDLKRKPAGVRGYEMLREDMNNPAYDRLQMRHMQAFRTQRNSHQDHHRVHDSFKMR